MEKPTIDKYPPSELKHASFKEMLKSFKDSAKPSEIMTANYIRGYISEIIGNVVFSEATVKGWLNYGKIPKNQNWNVLCAFIKDHCCNDDVSDAWISALATIRDADKTKIDTSEIPENCDEIKNAKTETSPNCDKTQNDEDKANQKYFRSPYITKVFTIFKNIINWHKQYYYALIIIPPIIIMLVLITMTPKNTTATSINNQLEQTPSLLQVKDEVAEVDNLTEAVEIREEGKITEVVELIQADKNLIRSGNTGLLMDVYLFQKKHKSLPAQPTGISLATLPHPNGGRFSFVDHYADKTVANTTQDRDMGLHYFGFINIEQSGEHLFSIEYQSGRHVVNQIFKKCRAVLTINNQTVFNMLENVGRGEHLSRQDTLMLPEGKNKLSLWFTCNNLRSLTPKWDYNAFKNTVLNLSVKRPNDSKITLINQAEFTH